MNEVNRRKAIKNIFFFSVSTSVGFGGYKLYKVKKKSSIHIIHKYEDLIAELAETIIPATNTPGAKQAKVHEFIMSIITDCTSNEGQNTFLEGLQDLEKYCESHYQAKFVQCTYMQKVEVLKYFEQQGLYKYNIINKIKTKLFGQTFFNQLKSLTVYGYCMSFYGVTKGLVYDFIPGSYQPCLPLQLNQRSWATK